MKVHIVCYEDLDLWILGKFARKLNIELNALGIQCDVSNVPDPSADINHHIIYFYYDGKKTSLDTVMITHIDEDWKLEQVKSQLKVAPMGICMSASTVDQLTNCGVPRERLCHVLPAHDEVMVPRKTVVGITSKIHSDGRKRESMLLELTDQISPTDFTFKIMGAGWGGIVDALKLKGFEVDYFDSFDFQLNQDLVPTFDYYLYLGLDEGAMGFVDALAAGVKTIATPQGYHLEAKNGITHPFTELQELIAIFTFIADSKRKITNSVASWTWREYAIRHIEIWKYLLTGNPRQYSSINRGDGIFSIVDNQKQLLLDTTVEKCPPLSSKKKILIICSHFWPSMGGLESRMGQFGYELIQSGYMVTVLTQAHEQRQLNDYRGIKIYSYEIDKYSTQIQKNASSGDYDACILVQDPLGNIIWSLENLKIPQRTRILIQPIINEEGYAKWKDHPSFGLRLSNILKKVGIPIVMTKNGPDTRYMDSMDINPIYIPNAISTVQSDGDFRKKYGIEKNDFLILHVANLYWVKNHIGLMNAMKNIPKNWRLVLIGNPTGEPECIKAVETELSNRPEILFIPGLSRDGISSAMQACDVVVLSSLGEGSPITILEAMSQKKPWLATPECGAANDHLGGIVCKLEEFTSFISVLDRNRDLANSLGLIGYKHWEAVYSWGSAIHGWIELIEHGYINNSKELDVNLIIEMSELNAIVQKEVFKSGKQVKLSKALVTVIVFSNNSFESLSNCLKSLKETIGVLLEVKIIFLRENKNVNELDQYLDPLILETITIDHEDEIVGAVNNFINTSKGSCISFLRDCDSFKPEHLISLVDAIKYSGKKIIFSKANYTFDNYSEETTEIRRGISSELTNQDQLFISGFMPFSNLCVNRTFFDEIGCFSEDLQSLAFWEWMLRAINKHKTLELPHASALIDYENKVDYFSHPKYGSDERNQYIKIFKLYPANSDEILYKRIYFLIKKYPILDIEIDIFNFEKLRTIDAGVLSNILNGSISLIEIVELGQIYLSQGELQIGIAIYQFWIMSNDTNLNFAALYNLGTILEKVGDLHKAKIAYGESLRLNTSFDMARLNLERLTITT